MKKIALINGQPVFNSRSTRHQRNAMCLVLSANENPEYLSVLGHLTLPRCGIQADSMPSARSMLSCLMATQIVITTESPSLFCFGSVVTTEH